MILFINYIIRGDPMLLLPDPQWGRGVVVPDPP